jgi:integrase
METHAYCSQDQVSQGPGHALIDPKTESVLIEELRQPVKHRRTQRLREQLRDVRIIARDTGMRPSEIFRIRIEHIDWSGRESGILTGKQTKLAASRA